MTSDENSIQAEELAKEAIERIGADSPNVSFVARVAFIFISWTTLHFLILGLFAAGILPGGWLLIFTIFALTIASLLALLQRFRRRTYPSALRRLFVHRPFWYTQVSLFVLNVTAILAFLVALPFGNGLGSARVALAIGSILLIGFFFAGWIGSYRLTLRRLTISFPDLPPRFEGFTVAQITDVHVGPHTSRRFLDRIAQAVIDAEPDLVAFTGDLVDDFHEDVRHFNAAFGKLPNAFAVLGNHDVYAGWSEVRSGLQSSGIRVLVNEALPIECADESIWLAGTGDPSGAQTFIRGGKEIAPDIPRTLASVPKGAFVVALAHNPMLWPALVERGVQLTLSGHTHHGQISIPALNWSLASVFLEFAMGLYERGLSKLYVAPGTNYWGLPLRLGAWPEVTLVRLVREKI